MLYIISFCAGLIAGFLFAHFCHLVDQYQEELTPLTSRKLRDLYRSVVTCCEKGLRKKTTRTRIYLACIKSELQRRGDWL